MEDIQCLKNQYEWLLELNDDELSQRVIDTNDVQNALIELLRFVDDVLNLPELGKTKGIMVKLENKLLKEKQEQKEKKENSKNKR